MAGVRRSRAAHTGTTTRNYDKLKAIPFYQPEEVQDIRTNEVNTILKTLLKTESGYTNSIEEAQEFAPTDEEEEAAFQEEEQDAIDLFSHTLSNARALGQQLLTCKSTLCGISTFKTSLTALQKSLDTEPDQDNSTSLLRLQALFFSLREQWVEADLPLTHPIKDELDKCEETFTTMEREVSAARIRSLPAVSLPAPPSMSTSFSSSGAPAYKYIELPKIKVPKFNGDIMGWSTFWSTFKSTVDD